MSVLVYIRCTLYYTVFVHVRVFIFLWEFSVYFGANIHVEPAKLSTHTPKHFTQKWISRGIKQTCAHMYNFVCALNIHVRVHVHAITCNGMCTNLVCSSGPFSMIDVVANTIVTSWTQATYMQCLNNFLRKYLLHNTQFRRFLHD